MKNRNNKLLLRACPRCHGDLFPDIEDQDLFACLQCGRRIPESQLPSIAISAPQLAPAA